MRDLGGGQIWQAFYILIKGRQFRQAMGINFLWSEACLIEWSSRDVTRTGCTITSFFGNTSFFKQQRQSHSAITFHPSQRTIKHDEKGSRSIIGQNLNGSPKEPTLSAYLFIQSGLMSLQQINNIDYLTYNANAKKVKHPLKNSIQTIIIEIILYSRSSVKLACNQGNSIKGTQFQNRSTNVCYYIFIIISSKRGIQLHEDTVPPSQPPKTKAQALKQPCTDTIEGKIASEIEEQTSNSNTISIQIKSSRQQHMYNTALFHTQSREKIKTYISLPKNKRTSLLRSNSSLEKKLYPENRQKNDDFTIMRQIRSFTRASDSIFQQFQAHQVLQSLLASSVAFEKQNKTICFQRRDLLTAISIMLNNDSSTFQYNKFGSFWQMLKEIRAHSSISTQQSHPKGKKNTLKIHKGVIKLTYLPMAPSLKTLTLCNNTISHTYKQRNNGQRNSYQFQIRRIRDSLLSQQNLVTNIKNCHRVKHFSRQDDRLEIPVQPRPETNLAVQYMLEQNQLLMKVANQEFKKYESEIYQYGLLLQSKHLEIDIEYQQFLAQSQQDTSALVLQESIRTIVINPIKADCFKYDDISKVLQAFLDKNRIKDAKLRKLIQIKSTFIAEFSSKMEFWIESLAFKKEFTQNLGSYIEKQGEYSQQAIGAVVQSLQDRNYQSIQRKVEVLRQSLEVFFENLLNSHQFS